MSDYQDQDYRSAKDSVSSKLHICLFATQQQLAQPVIKLLNSDRYELKCLSLAQELVDFITKNKEHIDCVVVVNQAQNNSVLEQLWQSGILLPIVIVEVEQLAPSVNGREQASTNLLEDGVVVDTIYHQAEIRLYPTQLTEINSYINLAISKFLSLAPSSNINNHKFNNKLAPEEEDPTSLIFQQRRLTEKLKERLGYLGVYYKRNANCFYRNLSPEQQNKLYQDLSKSYRRVLLEYFSHSSKINQLIDEFVDQAFFADFSTSQILEMHMELIDDFSHQLHLEGRNDDILLDYRLPLIDIIAHLCEMYRRSIPGEDVSLELLFRVE